MPGNDIFDTLSPDQESETQPTLQYVYVLVAEGTHEIKVGYSRDVISRRAQLQPGNPRLLRILLLLPCHDAPGAEQRIKERYASVALRGEWFALPDDYAEGLKMLASITELVVEHSTQMPATPDSLPLLIRPTLTDRILAILLKHGPATTREVQRRIGGSRSEIIQACLTQLLRDNTLTVRKRGKRVEYLMTDESENWIDNDLDEHAHLFVDMSEETP